MIKTKEEQPIPIKDLDDSFVVKDVRQQLKLSQEELTRELGVSYATISRW